MTTQPKVTWASILFGCIVGLAFSWFTTWCLVTGKIPTGVRGGPVTIIIEKERPTAYWIFLGTFIVITLFGWFAIGLNAYRLRQGKDKDQKSLE
ncbi:MAG TPA: hypothetical protein VGN23_13935 [Verrucomicrobiae bacterium]|jgi:hypothetical protein